MTDHTAAGTNPPTHVEVSAHLQFARLDVTELVDLLTEGLLVDRQLELARRDQVRRHTSSRTDSGGPLAPHVTAPGASTDQPGRQSR